MKELSIEEKAKAYDEVVNKLKGFIMQGVDPLITRADVQDFFPELAESNDERIRKEIISLVQYTKGRRIGYEPRISQDEMLAWLEKQGKKTIWHNEDEEPQRGSLILLIMQSGTPIVAKIIEPNHTFNHGERWAYIDDLLEKQGEKPIGIRSRHATGKLGEIIKDIESEKVEAKFKVGDEIKTGNEESLTITKIDEKGYWSEDLFICSFEDSTKWELVGRLVDKVEPFHEGDWVVQDNVGIYKVIEVCESWYEVVDDKGKHYSIGFDKEYMCHLWSIDDAKDGDVLVCKGNVKYSNGIKYERICLFNNLDNAFFTLTKNSNYVEEYDIYVNIDYPDNTVPATKEQKEILFMAIKEAGYEWNSEKKELRKIEHKFEESDGESIRKHIISVLEDCWQICKNIDYDSSRIQEDIAWLKKQHDPQVTDAEMKEILRTEYEKGRADAISEMQKEWSDEDEKRTANILSVLSVQVCWDGATLKKMNPYQKEIDWLKFLKQRIGG